jgi:hypothetical protein
MVVIAGRGQAEDFTNVVQADSLLGQVPANRAHELTSPEKYIGRGHDGGTAGVPRQRFTTTKARERGAAASRGRPIPR